MRLAQPPGNASNRKTSEGPGVGSAMTKSIVDAHKGTIQAFSSNGSTHFSVTFPAADAGR